jgi:nitrite reductase/ring-hydroxylating ferredoxin subunit
MRELRLVSALDLLENFSGLDGAVSTLQKGVKAVIRPRWLRDLLHGVPFGHPAHPVAVQIPIGAWMSAAVLDAVPGTDKAARALVGIGVLSAVPAAVAGATDWSDLHEQQMRVGLVHWASNAVAIVLYAGSYVQRRRGKTASGKMLGYLGLGAVSLGGFIGGHLAYRQAAGANHSEDVPHRFPQGWQRLGELADLAENELTPRTVAGIPLMVRRRGESVTVLSDVCSHLSAPLHEGAIIDVAGETCVECPWHGSVFALKDGAVVHGPATSPQPRFQTRVDAGIIEILLPNAG